MKAWTSSVYQSLPRRMSSQLKKYLVRKNKVKDFYEFYELVSTFTNKLKLKIQYYLCDFQIPVMS